jgi:hypothetical protein
MLNPVLRRSRRTPPPKRAGTIDPREHPDDDACRPSAVEELRLRAVCAN